MPPFEVLRASLESVRIAHHIRGRIRFKLEGSLPDVDASSRNVRGLQPVLDRLPGVYRVKLNLLARSCTVEYDPDVIPAQAWHDFLAGTESAAAAVLERIMLDAYREIADAQA